MTKKFLKIKKNSSSATVPTKATEYAAGFDLFAKLENDVLKINPQETKIISCGISMEIPKNHVGLIFARSGLSVKFGIGLANGVGVIDSDYRGEICVALKNFGNNNYTVSNNDRIAQIVIIKYENFFIKISSDLSETSRGNGGFGSTGK